MFRFLDSQRVKSCASVGSGLRHLMLSDRIEIERHLAEGVSLAGVAKMLGVHRSPVSREVRSRFFRPDRVYMNARPCLRR